MSLITATDSLQANNIDSITAGALNIGGTNATSIALNEPVTASGTLNVTGVTTATGGLKVNAIDSIASGALSLGGTNATSIALNEPTTASGTLSVTGVTTATGGIRSNSINTISASFPNTLAVGAGATNIDIGALGNNTNIKGYFYSGSIDCPDTLTSLTMGTSNAVGSIEIGNALPTMSIVSRIFKLNIANGNGNGTPGQVLISGGAGTCSWATVPGGGTVVQTGETSAITTITGTVTYSSSYAVKPKIQLTLNLNGGGTVIIPIAVSSHTTVSTNYTGFTWIAGATSTTATISWYATF